VRILAWSAVLVLAFKPALAQDAKTEIQKYQRMIAEDSPAELYALEGEALWKKKQGPKNMSLEACDLGAGPGALKGAYAGLPRYFKDADRVMDLETRLLYCMMTLQGRPREEATKRVFGDDNQPSEMEYLSAYVATQSSGVKMPRRNRDRRRTDRVYVARSASSDWISRVAAFREGRTPGPPGTPRDSGASRNAGPNDIGPVRCRRWINSSRASHTPPNTM